MAAVIRKGAVLLAVPALMGAFASSAAAADPAADPNPPDGVDVRPASPADFSNCPAGFVCYYTGHNGTGAMCAWQFADANHAVEPGGVCPWAADTNVLSIYNHGTSPEFAGVCSYEHAGYADPVGSVLPQGSTANFFPGSFKRMSHKWVRPGVGC